MIAGYLQKNPVELMAEHGKSFSFASMIFSSPTRKNISVLYSLCRYIDDCADELPQAASTSALESIHAQLSDPRQRGELQQLLHDLEGRGVRRCYLKELVKGARLEVQSRRIKTDRELMYHCFRVAGVVGLMVCPLIGVQDRGARRYAVSLGIAMQITNICRDILEDACNDRFYLPMCKLKEKNLRPSLLCQFGPAPAPLKKLVEEYLDLADRLYERAYRGLPFIPLRPRLAVLVAAEVYRGIGRKIRRQGYEVLNGRTSLKFFEKTWIAIQALPRLLRPSFWRLP